MGKAVKHSAMLRRKSSGAIFRKRVFRGNQILQCLIHAALKHRLQTLPIEKRIIIYYQHQLENYNL